MRTAINETRKANGKEEMPKRNAKSDSWKIKLLEIDRKSRSLNEGFSGGEKA
jgi:Fe-S cluster assembly ATP-binding protein